MAALPSSTKSAICPSKCRSSCSVSFRRRNSARSASYSEARRFAHNCATHRDLKGRGANGRFRLDLYYRLNVFPIKLLPLREHEEDLP